MSFKSIFGLDGIDLAIQGAITAALIVSFGFMGDEEGLFIGGSFVLIGSLALLGIRRSLALRRLRRSGGDELAAERIAELEQRVGELELGQSRVAELEERLDFAERLLAERRARDVVGPGGV